MDCYRLTIHEAHDLLRKGELTSVELTQTVLDRIAAVDNQVRAYLTLTPEFALERARLADERWSSWRTNGGEEPPALLGIPLAIKDVICLEGVPTTCGSKILENFVPPYSATMVERVAAQGAVVFGQDQHR